MPEIPEKVEVIESGKDGTLERLTYPECWKMVKQSDGSEKAELVKPWELRATGRKTNALRGSFKDVKDSMLQEGMKDWEAGGGDLKITKPDGSVDTIRADKEHLYRQIPGFCEKAVRPSMVCNVPWEGSLKRRGLRYSKSIMRNGELVTVEER